MHRREYICTHVRGYLLQAPRNSGAEGATPKDQLAPRGGGGATRRRLREFFFFCPVWKVFDFFLCILHIPMKLLSRAYNYVQRKDEIMFTNKYSVSLEKILLLEKSVVS